LGIRINDDPTPFFYLRSAFAPDFKELDENIDYEERESEFDLEDEDKSIQQDEEQADVDVEVCYMVAICLWTWCTNFFLPSKEVDVVTEAKIPAFCDSDAEEDDKDGLLYLPIAPEVEDPEEGWPLGLDGPGAEDSPSKRPASQESKENTSPKKKRLKPIDVDLPKAPRDGTCV
jgi:COMPASS component SWD1